MKNMELCLFIFLFSILENGTKQWLFPPSSNPMEPDVLGQPIQKQVKDPL